jgi:hypothetical protein
MQSKLILCALTSVGALALLASCAANYTPPPQALVKAPELPALASPPPDRASALSYGMVTGRVKKGVTTQQEILELFGGPSTMTTDKDGGEVWMYDKTTSTVFSSSAQSGSQATQIDASGMAAFFGIPLVAGVGGESVTARSQAAQVSQGASAVTHSVKTITFIIKFDKSKTVKDYAVRQSSY